MNTEVEPINKRARTKARHTAVQALYQWFLTDKDSIDIIAEFENNEHKLAKTDVDYFKTLFRGVIRNKSDLEQHFSDLVDRPLEELDYIELAILLIGCYELQNCIEMPYRVVVNESVELAKTFGAEESHKYINGVMDKLARQLRQTETQ